MITVSDSFKKAIKSENREIHGYVEVEYQNKSFNTSVTSIPTHSEIVSDDGIILGDKTLQKYATLESNYTLLDGSFMVWNENIILESGYVSDDVFDDINDTTIIITNNSTNLSTKGITIYFKENLPFDFNVTFTDTNDEQIIDNVSNNQSYTYQYFFDVEKNIKTVTININRVEFSNNRLRIAYVDFNIGDLYEGDELVSFDVTEELDLLLNSLPSNTCVVKLNNYPDKEGKNKFDIINMQGIAKYLTTDTILKTYIGVLTETNGVEYVLTGTFYLNNWTSDVDSNVTLNGISSIGKLSDKVMSSNGSFLTQYFVQDELPNELSNMTGLKFDADLPISRDRTEFVSISNYWLKTTNLLGYIQSAYSPYLKVEFTGENVRFFKFYTARNNNITFNELITTSVDRLNRNLLLKDVDVQLNPKINNLEVSEIRQNENLSYIAQENIINDTYTLTKETEYVWYELSKVVHYNSATFNYSVVSGSGSAQLIDANYNLAYIKYTGTVGSQINVTYFTHTYNRPSEHKKQFTNNIQEGNKITLNYYDYGRYAPRSLVDYFLNRQKQYKISAKTMGDPSLEIGDTISIQTRYTDVNDGYKDIIITKQQFTFDGGLQCSLEGVGD